MSWLRAFFIALLSVIVAVVGYVAYLNYQFIHHPLIGLHERTVQPVTVRVFPHSRLRQLASTLSETGLWQRYYSFLVLAEIHGVRDELRFGEYQIEPGMTLMELLKNIQQGRGQVFYPFRIREGSTMTTLKQRLMHSDLITHTDVLKSPDWQPKFSAWLGEHRSLEGMLYPDTYHFAWGVDDARVIRVAYRAMIKRLKAAWPKRQRNLPISTPYQALIVASLIQTEAGLVKERPMVAGVIYNRLKRSMRLQIDPTVVYGLGLPYGTKLTKTNLRTKTSYNTYIIKGLPPTPIAFPTWTSIQAALHPANTKAIFYVADARGGHVFSTHYKAHKKAVTAYRAAVRGKTWVAEKEAVEAVFDATIKE